MVFAALMLGACGSKNDSKAVAEDQNDEKFDKSTGEADAEFAVKAADGGMLEVQLGQLAVSSASSPQVKEFAQMMVDDHSKANEELKTLASGKGISIPTTLSDKNMKKYNDLAEKSGHDFDKDYIDLMVKDHKEDIDEFKKEADKGKVPELAKWASEKLPTLEHHLQLAQSAQETVKNSNDAKK
jgi:putative membrane protein